MHFLFRILLIQLNEQTGNDWRRHIIFPIVSCFVGYCKLYNEVNTSVCIDSFSFVQREKSMFSCCVRFVLTRSAGTRYNTLALASCKKNKDKSIAL